MITHCGSSPHAGATTVAVSGRTRIKVCGITRLDDALYCAGSGADAIGFVFAESKRRIEPTAAARIVRALPPFVMAVGVFVDDSPDRVNEVADCVGLHAVQLHGSESPGDCASIRVPVIKRFDVTSTDTPESLGVRIDPFDVAAYLLDPGAGDGRAFDHAVAAGLSHRLVIAGGLTADNVSDAIAAALPWAVDVCSGVEKSPGVKDRAKIQAFIEEVRHHDAHADC